MLEINVLVYFYNKTNTCTFQVAEFSQYLDQLQKLNSKDY